MKQTLKIILASALITVAAIKAAPALAEPAFDRPHVVVVHTGDLDLGAADGRRLLDVRLARAATEVCGAASSADLAGKNQVRRCRDEVLEAARKQRAALLTNRRLGDGIRLAAAR